MFEKSIENLYYMLLSGNGSWNDSEEVKEAQSAIEEYLTEDVYILVESEVCRYGIACEKQGFVNGFRYAVSLLMDRGNYESFSGVKEERSSHDEY